MTNQILMRLKSRLDDLSKYGEIDVETERNALKEDLQYYVLEFIYHHSEYSNWTMYGGSALRICHKLNRMSVDLDFEIVEPCTDRFLNKLKKEIESYFSRKYATENNFLSIKVIGSRGLLLKFNIGDELGMGHPSKQVHVKIDLNHFLAPKTVIERIPVSQYNDQLSFVIKTYNLSALMASKIVAIFLRGTRGVGADVYEEKGRDIYDLLWYMDKKAVPDLDYLKVKGVDVSDLRALFDKLTLKMNDVNNSNLAQDLKPLFLDQNFITHWLLHWRESYFRLLKEYSINLIAELQEISIFHELRADVFYFKFYYKTEDNKLVSIIYSMSDYWVNFAEGEIPTKINESLTPITKFIINGSTSRPASREKLNQYVSLFYNKSEAYLKKTNHIILGDNIITKMIIMSAGNFNQKEQIVLNKSALLSCQLEDLLK
ncbi:MAG: nucleotidyl transferase AbiEii/AbiGii toxin family protein [Minisyncoccia bacterium]